MGEVNAELEMNNTFVSIPEMKSLPKGIKFFESDDIIDDDKFLKDLDEDSTDDDSPSYFLMIFLPLASLVVIIVLAAAALRWKYTSRNHTFSHSKDKCNTQTTTTTNTSSTGDNNNKSKTERLKSEDSEAAAPLKNRTQSTSSSASSTVSRDILIEGSKPVVVDMRIAPDSSNQDILKSSRTDLYCEISTSSENISEKPFCEKKENIPDSVKVECEILKEKVENINENIKEENKKSVQLPAVKPEDIITKRPKTLGVMTVVDSNKANSNCSKGFPWLDQLWTPDADIIYEDTNSPITQHPPHKEREDSLFPLMAKGRFKMKPKGLLERRGSNVALTISLKNEEKSCSSPPPSSKSPKPLVYLRTATAKLDPIQLNVKANDTARLQQEFWEVPMNHPSEKHFSIPGYGTKNRYRSILPNPHSRVLLPATPSGDPLSAYINANYVRGYSTIVETERRRQSEDGKENDARRMSMKRKAGYIATQGPMANTIVDFWKMIWREKSTAIVMITKLKEKREKCSEYMPLKPSEKRTYENFEIEVKNVRSADHYTVRTIEVRNSEEENVTHTIYHYWYSEWLDHDTPEKLRGLLTLIQEVDLKCPDVINSEHGPVIVHCSAGIGRTGCFIAISIGCRQLKVEGKVDVLKIICQLRMDRGGMIQTWEQYQYVHVALNRYARILAGENVNTPSTASSIQTPDSCRTSSRHSTPVSAGSGSNLRGLLSPQASTRLFSPKIPELTTVDESGVTPEDPMVKLPPSTGDDVKTIFSPRPEKSFSRFSFSCAGDANIESIPEGENGTDASDVTRSQEGDLTTSKRTRSSTPPQLLLKLTSKPSPVREENWLINGHCSVSDDFENGVDNTHDSMENNDNNFTNGLPNALPNSNRIDIHCNTLERETKSASPNLDNNDLGKLKRILSPVKDCQTAPSESSQTKSIFTFPSS
ncbi:uncharacterized protein LOC120333631 [Styela clava]